MHDPRSYLDIARKTRHFGVVEAFPPCLTHGILRTSPTGCTFSQISFDRDLVADRAYQIVQPEALLLVQSSVLFCCGVFQLTGETVMRDETRN